jgi:hypothetical protein
VWESDIARPKNQSFLQKLQMVSFFRYRMRHPLKIKKLQLLSFWGTSSPFLGTAPGLIEIGLMVLSFFAQTEPDSFRTLPQRIDRKLLKRIAVMLLSPPACWLPVFRNECLRSQSLEMAGDLQQ